MHTRKKTRTRELFQSSIISSPGGVSMHEHAAAASLTESDREQSSDKRALQLGVPSFAGGLIQGACALLMATNAGKALLPEYPSSIPIPSEFRSWSCQR